MLIILAMLFITVETLSMIFGHSFTHLTLFGIEFNFITGVMFFCFSFWILDLITELYDDKKANIIIYGKIICQIVFLALINFGSYVSSETTNIANSMSFVPRMIIAGVIASLIGYKLTSYLMQKFKIKYEGKYMTLRYIISTLPGEIVFSFIYSSIFLWNEFHDAAYLQIFYSLIVAKLFFSLLFATFFSPVNKLISILSNNHYPKNSLMKKINF